jgi:hypothetical protein
MTWYPLFSRTNLHHCKYKKENQNNLPLRFHLSDWMILLVFRDRGANVTTSNGTLCIVFRPSQLVRNGVRRKCDDHFSPEGRINSPLVNFIQVVLLARKILHKVSFYKLLSAQFA